MICFERVRYLREEHEMTQKMVANILKVDKSTYAAWERGRDLFPLKRLNSVCNIFNVSLDYITGQTDIKNYEMMQNDINPELLMQRVKEIRSENNYTQEHLAEYLNTTHSAISAYENGHQIMPLIFLFEISKMFQISMDWILGKTNQKYLEPKKELINT